MVVPASLAELGPGSMVGEYRIEGLLGEGGMGRVYSAIHPIIAKRAAIKVLHPELSVNQEAVDRFAQEARAVNQIGHDNIVDIFAFGTLPDGRSYFVMEWMRGRSLRDRLRASPLPIQQALTVLDVIALALEAAHEVGIVHRDLKPDNIFLVEKKGTEPTVKLLDFGIAKLLGNESERSDRTQTGNLLGTPAYISPEQARGQHVDHRTDIYALGCLTYELFTNSLPFPAESAADMLAKHLFEPPPSARVRNPSVPVQLDQLIVTMLSKESASRPTLEQFRSALQPFRATGFANAVGGVAGQMHTPSRMSATNLAAHAATMADGTSPVRKGGRRTGAYIGGVLAVVTTAAVTMALMMSGGKKPPPAPPTEPAPSTSPIDTSPVPKPPDVTKSVEKVDEQKIEKPKPDDIAPIEVTKPVDETKEDPPKSRPSKPNRPGRPHKPSKPNKPAEDDRDDAM